MSSQAPGRENEGERLAAALQAAGFPIAGRGRGHIRFGWPGSPEGRGNLVVLIDDTAPEYPEHLNAVRAQLGHAARLGRAAEAALGSRQPDPSPHQGSSQ